LLVFNWCNPRYKTIADFRKDHSKAFREVFRRFVYLLRERDLIDGEGVAINSIKIRAGSSPKNNFNEKKLTERHEKKAHYEQVSDQLKASGQGQISLNDPGSRPAILHKNIINVGYNVQAASESKHKLLVEYGTGEVNDTHALKTNGTWHRHSNSRPPRGAYRFRRYTTPACKGCATRHLCTKGKTNGRYIDRSEYAEVIQQNARRVESNPEYYRLRQQVTGAYNGANIRN
jgi:hypothetical protein